MSQARRRALIAVAVLLPAALVLGARQVGAPAAAPGPAAAVPPVFVGRVTPDQTLWRIGPPLRVAVEISADQPVRLDGVRVWPGDGGDTEEVTAFAVGTEPRTVPFEVVFGRRGDHALVLQVRLVAGGPWLNLPPSARVIVS